MIEQEALELEYKVISEDSCIDILLRENILSLPLWYYCCMFLISDGGKDLSSRDIYELDKSYWFNNFIKYVRDVGGPILSRKSLKMNQKLRDVDILFISRDRLIKIETDLGTVRSDYLFASIITKLREEFPNIKMSLACTSNDLEDMNISTYNTFQFLRPMDFLKAMIFSLRITIPWLKHRNSLDRKLNLDQIGDFSPLSRIDVFFSFKMVFTRCLNDYAYSNLFSTFDPKIIISNDDIMQLKPKAMNENAIFMVIQSALMSPINEHYRKQFISYYGDESLKSDYFLCSGDYFKELKECAGVSKRVLVTGQPRYDALSKIGEQYNKTKIIQEMGLSPSKKTILWTTQTHGLSYIENKKCIETVYSAMSSLSDAQLIIKLHPDEDQDAPLYVQNHEYEPIILGKDVDTNLLLSLCDLLITKNSTTALEATILDKPIIILNLSGKPDKVDYVNEGIALGVYESANFTSTIWNSLYNEQVSKRLEMAREQYIKKYLYRKDGKATERIVNLIKSLLPNVKTT